MFSRIDDDDPVPEIGRLRLTFEQSEIPFRLGDSLAAALLAAGVRDQRDNAADGGCRAPYCMMGVCFECLVEVDGKQNQQSCLTPARPGMNVRRQKGARRLP